MTERVRLPGGIGSIIAAVWPSSSSSSLPSANRQPGETLGAALRRAELERLSATYPPPVNVPDVPDDYYPPSTPEFPSDTPPAYEPPPGRDDQMIVVPPYGPDDIHDELGGYTPAHPQPIADVQTPPPRVSSSSSSPTSSPPAVTLPPGPDTQQPPPRSYRGPGNIPSGGWSWDVYRRDVERAISDTAKRIGAGVIKAAPTTTRGAIETIGRRITGPLGSIIEVFTPGSLFGPEILGSGELPLPDQLHEIQLPPSAVRVPSVTPTTAARTAVPPASAAPPSVAPPPSSPARSTSPTSSPTTSPTSSPTSSPTTSSNTRTPPSRSSMTVPRARGLIWPIAQSLAVTALLRSNQTTPAPFSWPTPAPAMPVLPIAQPLPTPTTSPPTVPTITTPVDPLTPPRIPGVDPLTPISSSNPLTPLNTAQASFPPTRTATRARTKECRCDDKPKKRKKPRECFVRGQLVWSSGPKKGQAAGSRCVKF